MALDREPEIGLISLSAANHEIGNLYDVPAFVAAAREVRPDILFHCDAVQAIGKVAIDFHAWGVDLLSLSAHKIYGPKGVGALLHRRGLELRPLLFGGRQERGRRPGSEATALLAGFGVAVDLAVAEREVRVARISERRRQLLGRLSELPTLRVYGDPASAGNTVCVGIEGCEGQLMLINLDLLGIMVSTGSACSAGNLDPSPVLLALGCTPEEGRSVLRISLGKDTSEAEIDALVAALPEVIARVRAEA